MLSSFLAAAVLVAFFQDTYIYSVYLNRKVNNILSISVHGSWITHSFNKTAAVKFCPGFAGGWDKKQWGFIVSARVFVQDSSRCSSTLQKERVGPFFYIITCSFWVQLDHIDMFLHNSTGHTKFRNIMVFSRLRFSKTDFNVSCQTNLIYNP